MTRLILIRHGQTDYNFARRYCGFSDPPLNEEGIRQARHLASGLKGMRIDRVYSSDLKRARQTAEIVFPKGPVERTRDWREMNFGLFEGLTYEQAMEKYPTLYRNWADHPIEVQPPDGERFGNLRNRVQQNVSAILCRHGGQTVAVVTHGGPAAIVLCNALQFDQAMFRQMQPAHGDLTVIDYTEGTAPAVIVNDISALSVRKTAAP